MKKYEFFLWQMKKKWNKGQKEDQLLSGLIPFSASHGNEGHDQKCTRIGVCYKGLCSYASCTNIYCVCKVLSV